MIEPPAADHGSSSMAIIPDLPMLTRQRVPEPRAEITRLAENSVKHQPRYEIAGAGERRTEETSAARSSRETDYSHNVSRFRRSWFASALERFIIENSY